MSQAKILTQSEFRKILLHIAKKKHHARKVKLYACLRYYIFIATDFSDESQTLTDASNPTTSVFSE